MNADFVIPFMMDSEDRLRNLLRTLIYLSDKSDSKIFVANQIYNSSDTLIKNYVEQFGLSDNIKILNIEIEPPCYKTKLINIGIDESISDNIIMYDCDVLIPFEQIEMSVELCDKDYSLVYPYSNPQYDVRQNYFEQFYENYDFISMQKDIDPFQIPHNHKREKYPIIGYSPGFCLTLSKKKLGKSIYYNEGFRSAQYEDSEYIFKMDFLNIKMHRIYGPVFHFQHERVTENKFNNIIQNNRTLFYSIIRKTPEELKNYYTKE